MGKPQSKSVTQDGTTNVNINEHIENNELLHQSHEIKLYIIIVINLFQLVLVLRNTLRKKWRRQGFERAQAASMDNLAHIRVEK